MRSKSLQVDCLISRSAGGCVGRQAEATIRSRHAQIVQIKQNVYAPDGVERVAGKEDEAFEALDVAPVATVTWL